MAYAKYVILFLLFCSSLSAITANWNVNTDGNWNDGTKWTGGTFPNAVDDVAVLGPIITASRTITLGQDITIGTLNLSSPNPNAYTVQSNNLIFQVSAGNAQITTAANTNNTINSSIVLNSPLLIDASAILNDLNLGGVISGNQPITINSTNPGAGDVVLNGSTVNTFSGQLSLTGSAKLSLEKTAGVTAISGDILLQGTALLQTGAGNANQFASTSTLTQTGGSFFLSGTTQTIGHFNYQAGTLNFGGGTLILASNSTALTLGSGVTIVDPLTFSGSGAIVQTGVVDMNSNLDLGGFTHNFVIGANAVDFMNYGGVISNGGITKTGPGLLNIGVNLVSNTYTGDTTIWDGILFLDRFGFISVPGNVIINGGELLTAAANQIDPTKTVTLNNGNFNLNNNALTIDHFIYNGGLIFNVPSPLTLAGTTALTMRNTAFSDGTILLSNSGSVVFDPTNNGTATIPVPLDLGPGTVTFNIGNGANAIDMDIQSVISPPGAGGITKTGAGRLAFTGAAANTYNGTTTVSGGVLSLDKAGVNAIVGPVTINGGSLLLSAQEQIDNGQTMTITAGNFAMQGFTETIDTLVFNGGAVTQSAGGLLNLQSAVAALTMGGNTDLNASIAITNGTGQVIFNGASGTATLNGALDLAAGIHDFSIADGTAAADMVINSVISNLGTLNKTGAGTLVLLGANTYAGGTTVTAGTLQGTTTSLQGGIVNNSTLVFDQDFDGSNAGTLVLSGLGNLIKQGSGTVRFVTPQAMTGPTTVAAGTLLINSTFGPLGSPLNVNLGGTLGGTGTINKDVTVSGTLSPGDGGIGTLTLNGTQAMATGSTLEIEITPTSNDLVNVGGTFDIQPGSIFSFTPEPNVYISPLFYTVVQTTGGVTGTFANAIDPFPLFQGQLFYTLNDVILQLLLLPISSVPGLSSNAAKVAHCLDGKNPDSGSDMFRVINDLRFLTSIESIEKALLRMQPSIFTSLAVVKESSTLNFRHTFFNRLETRGRSCGEDEKGYHYWGTPIVGFAKEKTHGREPGYNAFSPGVALGMDGFILPELQLGGSLAYTHSDINWNSERGKAVIHSVCGAIYGRYGSPVGYLDGAVVLGYDHYSTSRNIWFGGLLPLNRRAKGSHNGFESSVHLKGGCQLPVNGTHLGPYASVDFLYIYEGSFSENGANSLNLNIASKHPMLLQSEVGMDFSHCINLRRQSLIPFVHVGGIWEKRFNGEKEFSHFGKCPLDVRGYYPPSRVLVGTGGGFTIEWAKKSAPKASFSYKGKFGRGYQDQSLNFELIY